jgi:hypothetical protein
VKQLTMKLRCDWCGNPIRRMSGEHRCNACNDVLCDPNERLCWVEHYDRKHGPKPARKIEDTRPL